jgi:hypothetical protein
MKKYSINLSSLILLFVLISSINVTAQSSEPKNSKNKLTFNFQGPSVKSKTVYVCWIEDENGNNLQNIYVCNRTVNIGGGLLGDDLPYWKKNKSPVDGVTGASVQKSLNVTRIINIGNIRHFRVCFEIDRSENGNEYFYDRPSFIYRSDVIDLDKLQMSYSLNLYGWMANDNSNPKKYSQQPKDKNKIPGFEQYKLMTDTSFIADTSDMVSSVKAVISDKL